MRTLAHKLSLLRSALDHLIVIVYTLDLLQSDTKGDLIEATWHFKSLAPRMHKQATPVIVY